MNNLTACLIFMKYHIYNFSDCSDKIFFRVLFFYSNLYQCSLISIHFGLVCKLVSILSIPKSLFAFTFFTMFCIFLKVYYLAYKRDVAKQKNCPVVFSTPFCGKAKPYSYLQQVYQRSCSFCYNV